MPPSAKADAGVRVGQVFLGKYRVDAILGQGGMGVVAECTHLALNERIAIKMLRDDVLGDVDAKERFMREAQAASKLKSQHVAKVTDVGEFENGVPYMVMEFLDGHDLGALLEQQGVLQVGWAVELMIQAAEALGEAHALGIVHRDVKPTNLFVNWLPDGAAQIKVLDFGISKTRQGADMQLTQTQSLLGTPAYMSPEQMRSARLVDARTDIWSLGTVVYELLEGRRPFEAESFSEMCVKVAVDPPAPMVNTPPALQQVILRCLAKTPEQRYPSMVELARDLVPFARDGQQAQVLVDRMERRARRSAGDWEGGSMPGVPAMVRDGSSAPVPRRTSSPVLPQFGAGSDPAAQPWHGGSAVDAPALGAPLAGAAPQLAAELGSTPHTIRDGKPRRRALWLAVAVLTVAGGAAGGYLALGRHAAAPAATAAPAAVTTPSIATETPTPTRSTTAETPTKPPIEAPSSPAAGSAAASSATGSAAAGSAAGSAAAGSAAAGSAATPSVVKPSETPHASPTSHGHGVHRPRGTHRLHHTEVPKPPTTPGSKPKCDPFSLVGGC